MNKFRELINNVFGGDDNISEVKIFLKNMFEHFRKITYNGYYDFFTYLHYEKDYSYRFAPFLSEMEYFAYNIKTAVISMTTKNGEIYNLNQLVKFNEINSDYLEIIGVGNDISSINHDVGGAVIKFKINEDYFAKDILDIQKAVKCVDVIDNFDVYPMEIIEERVILKLNSYKLDEIKLIGDYAEGFPSKDSVVELVVDKNKLSGFRAFNFKYTFDNLFKCDVKVYWEDELDLNDKEVIVISNV